jgi:hypothetical protein
LASGFISEGIGASKPTRAGRGVVMAE